MRAFSNDLLSTFREFCRWFTKIGYNHETGSMSRENSQNSVKSFAKWPQNSLKLTKIYRFSASFFPVQVLHAFTGFYWIQPGRQHDNWVDNFGRRDSVFTTFSRKKKRTSAVSRPNGIGTSDYNMCFRLFSSFLLLERKKKRNFVGHHFVQ